MRQTCNGGWWLNEECPFFNLKLPSSKRQKFNLQLKAVVKFQTNEKLYAWCKFGEYFDWWYLRDGMQ